MKKKSSMIKYIASILILLSVFSCDDDEAPDNDALIQSYLQENNLTAERQESGLYLFIEQPNNGVRPTLSSEVEVKYKGYDLEGNVFDQRLNESIRFPLRDLILGWQEGLQLMSKGDKGVLYIPAALAYGSRSPSNGRPIIFEIELVDFR